MKTPIRLSDYIAETLRKTTEEYVEFDIPITKKDNDIFIDKKSPNRVNFTIKLKRSGVQ